MLVAAVALAAGVALSAGGAAAQGLFGGGLGYVKGFGGATWPQNDNFELDIGGVGTLIPTRGSTSTLVMCSALPVGTMITPNISVGARIRLSQRGRGAEGDEHRQP